MSSRAVRARTKRQARRRTPLPASTASATRRSHGGGCVVPVAAAIAAWCRCRRAPCGSRLASARRLGSRVSPSRRPVPAALVVDASRRDLAITPDGTHIVYKGGAGRRHAALRRAHSISSSRRRSRLPACRAAPFSSPDGQWIGFVEPAPVTLKKVAITGGPALDRRRLDGPSRGATWGDDDSIIVRDGAPATGLLRVPRPAASRRS